MTAFASGLVGWRVADLTARNALSVARPEVGKLAHVLSTGLFYPAVQAGSGASCWGEATDDLATSEVTNDSDVPGASLGDALEALRFRKITRTLAFDDVDVDLAALTAEIDVGSPLSASALVLCVRVSVGTAYTDGATGAFSLDVGTAADPNKYTASAVDLTSEAVTSNVLFLDAGEDQIQVTITGDVNLDTLTAGEATVDIYWAVME